MEDQSKNERGYFTQAEELFEEIVAWLLFDGSSIFLEEPHPYKKQSSQSKLLLPRTSSS